MHRFVGSAPDRIAGREFRLTEPLSEVFVYLVERLLHAELDDQRLLALAGPDDCAYLSEKECQLFAKRLEAWTDMKSCEYLVSKCQHVMVARLVETAAGPKLVDCTNIMLPKLLGEGVEELRRFLKHCGGFVVVVSEDEDDEGGKDCCHGGDPRFNRGGAS